MYVNVIGVIKNLRLETIGYRLLDTDDKNKVMDVKREQLISVLNSGKLKVENVELVNGKTLRGKYYSLDLLPCIMNEQQEYQKLIALCIIDNMTIRIASCAGNVVDIVKAQLPNIAPSLINMTNDGLKCPRIETEYFKEISNDGDRLDREVIDKDIIWTFRDFDKYMKKHGYSYMVTGYHADRPITIDNYQNESSLILKAIDDRCKLVKIPKEITYINGMYSCGTTIESLILSPYTRELTSLHRGEVKPGESDYNFIVNKLWLQSLDGNSYTPDMKLTGLCGITINSRIVLGNGYYKNFCNHCIIPSISIAGNVRTISNSFNDTKITNDKWFDTKNVRNIDSSFRRTELISIMVGDTTYSIDDSFNETHAQELVFSENDAMTAFARSFKALNITSLDLSPLIKLNLLGAESFKDCMQLVSVIFNNMLKTLRNGCFENCDIPSIELPSGLQTIMSRVLLGNNRLLELLLPAGICDVTFPLGGRNTVVKFTGQNKTLSSAKIERITDEDKVDFGEVFTELCPLALKNCKRKNIIPKSIRTLFGGSFTEASMPVYDTMSTPGVHSIPTGCFEGNVDIAAIIINDNITHVASQAFHKASGIGRIIISGKASGFETTAFSRMDVKSIPPKFYVVSSNEEAKKLLRAKKIDFEEIGDINEAMISIANTSEEVINGYRLIYGGEQEYRELFEEPYIKNIDIFMKVVNRIKRNDSVSFKKNTINTSKFMELPLSNYPRLYDRVDNICKLSKETIEKSTGTEVPDELSDRFIGIANLITALFNNNANCYSESFVKMASGIGNLDIVKMIAYCPYGAIFTAKYSTLPEHDINILMISIRDNIVFQTPFIDEDDKLPYSAKSVHNLAKSYVLKGWGIADLLEVGDSMSIGQDNDERYTSLSKMSFHSMEVPKSMLEGLKPLIRDSAILIGYIGNGRESHNRAQKALLYDTVQQMFIEVSGHYWWSGYSTGRIIVIKDAVVQNIYKLEQINEINKQYFELFTSYNRSEQVNNDIRLNSMTKEEIDRMFNDASQFDADGNEEICVLADYIYANDIKSKDELDGKIAPLLFETEFFVEYNGSINKCEKREFKREFMPLKHSSNMLLCYSDSNMNGCEIAGIVTSKTSKTKNGTLKVSMVPLNRIILALYSIGSKRANNNDMEMAPCQITNKPINIDNFAVIYTRSDSFFNRNGLKYLLALDKLNGDCYLICEYWDTEFYTLFRFKSILIGYNIIRNAEGRKMSDLRNLAEFEFKGSTSYNDSSFKEVRDAIMNGFPNCYPYCGQGVQLFKALAKQV